ncbi:hypothetical protein SAMN05421595_0734 [Austwickia chelonae]|uniref:RND efflux pump membrane fusion protein barrel-sandwich domain-containing protein n=1 Tax=Austwickia chelonae NBRC 105200 TaxID=1184607 RepID=K6VNC0_9MICO|nr:hypothetical protein [Austwickia chelonae]GAB78219.1 hypothetical protein AUCHE_08_04650 [Austwickia chelonae NBRC 105200]SEV98939.1 hypothetical protein SAMN05421595_0734 [Austwickia chelonae]
MTYSGRCRVVIPLAAVVLLGTVACGGPPPTPPTTSAPQSAAATTATTTYEVTAPTALSFSATLEANTAKLDELVIPLPEGIEFTPAPRFTKARACDDSGGAVIPCPGDEKNTPDVAAPTAPRGASRVRTVAFPAGDPPPSPTPTAPSKNPSGKPGAPPSDQGRAVPPSRTEAPSTTQIPSVPVAANTELGRFSLAKAISSKKAGTVAKSQLAQISKSTGPAFAAVGGAFTFTPTKLLIRGWLTVLSAPLTATQAIRFSHAEITGKATFPSTLGKRTADCQALVLAPPGSSTTEPRALCVLPEFSGTMPNLKATLKISHASGQAHPVVPEIYIRTDETGKDLIVTTLTGDGGTQEVPVVVGPGDGVRRTVLSGVAPGDKIVGATP